VRAALLALLIGCATSHKAESSFQQEQEVQSDKDVTRKIERGPVKVTVLEFQAAPATPKDADAGATSGVTSPSSTASPSTSGVAGLLASLPSHGLLLKATVTERAPEVSTTQEQTDTRSDARVQAASSSESTFRLGPGFWGWLGIGLAVAGVLFVVVRFKLWRFVL
jgi:hypothetical protein